MSTRVVGASLIAALFIAGAPAASAADLAGDPYDDPRYADIYRDAPPPQSSRYVERHEDRYVERDRHGYDDRPQFADDKYGGDKYDKYGDDKYEDDGRYDRGDRYGKDRCVPRHIIRRDLKAAGWGDFHGLEVRHNVILLQARRPSGRLFDLKVDRCTGDIVHAKACDGPYYGRYAYGPRRHYRY